MKPVPAHRLLPLAAAAILFFAAVSGVRAGEADPFGKRVKLGLFGGNFAEAAERILRQTGVAVSAPPGMAADGDLFLAGDMSLRSALERLARRFGCRYRLASPDRAELCRGYEWVDSEFAIRFHRLDRLLGPGESVESLKRLLEEFLKPLPLLPAGNFSLVLEQSPQPGGGTSVKAVAVLPPALAGYLDRAVACLEGDPGDAAGLREAEGPSLADVLARPVRLEYRGARLGDILFDLGIQAGVAIESDPELLRGKESLVLSLVRGRTTFGQALGEMARTLGAGGGTFAGPDVIRLEKAVSGGWREDRESREAFWSNLEVGGFPAPAGAAGNPSALAAHLKNVVTPWVWNDPLCAIGYSPAAGRLAAVAPPETLRGIGAELDRLVKGGRY